jgi:hypothetical protein
MQAKGERPPARSSSPNPGRFKPKAGDPWQLLREEGKGKHSLSSSMHFSQLGLLAQLKNSRFL